MQGPSCLLSWFWPKKVSSMEKSKETQFCRENGSRWLTYHVHQLDIQSEKLHLSQPLIFFAVLFLLHFILHLLCLYWVSAITLLISFSGYTPGKQVQRHILFYLFNSAGFNQKNCLNSFKSISQNKWGRKHIKYGVKFNEWESLDPYSLIQRSRWDNQGMANWITSALLSFNSCRISFTEGRWSATVELLSSLMLF